MPGGYREGSGRSKTGYYKGIYCGSTYELCWVVYALDHDIKFQRFSKGLKHNGVTYYPDFLLDDNVIVECKGYEQQDRVDAKTRVAEHHGYTVNVLRKSDLKFAFDYVTNKFNTTKYATLYDEYAPSYQYKCIECSACITCDTKRTTCEIFCSRQCSGKFRTKQQKNINRTELNQYIRKLTKDQALHIFNSPKAYVELSVNFGLSFGAISAIKNKKSYKWIHD